MLRALIISALCAAVSIVVGATATEWGYPHLKPQEGPPVKLAQNRTTGEKPRLGPPGTDPGVRTGAPTAGGYLSGISTDELNFAQDARTIYVAPWSISGRIPGAPIAGLGPRYHARMCFDCHSYPAAGGSSPATNLQYTVMPTLNGANNNTVPDGNYFGDGLPFIRSNGPTRLPWQPSQNTILHLYTVQGMSDAGSCTLAQPNFNSLLVAHDLTATIPIPTFGIGLAEGTPNVNLINDANTASALGLGITYGRFNHNGDGTISRIGWKASSSSIEVFTALALTNELGATTMIFPRKSDETSACLSLYHIPDDHSNLASIATLLNPGTSICTVGHSCGRFASSQVLDAAFTRSLAPPLPAWRAESTVPSGWNGSSTTAYTTASTRVTQGSVHNGQTQFNAVGCQACHIVRHTTGIIGGLTAQNNRSYFPYTDYALHNMGDGLWNGVRLGAAGPYDYRTAALWGAGQRLFFLHDGRTQDLWAAIAAHGSSESEAAAVISAFMGLSTQNQQDLLNFLRGL